MNEIENKKQRDLRVFQSRIDELEKEKGACKDKERLNRIEKEIYAYKQEVRLLTEIKEEIKKKKKKGRK